MKAMKMKQYGFLAIWCDMAAEDLDDYRAWLMQEHMADRTGLPGFLSARLFEGLDVPTSHFILYATEGPEAVSYTHLTLPTIYSV